MHSIIIPCYNGGRFILDAVESVRKCEDYELIIVNDGSDDEETLDILSDLSRKFCVINQKNKGLGAARNAGILASRGEYILPLDCDNKIRPEYLVLSKKILDKNEGIGVVYSQAEYFGDETQVWCIPEYDRDAFIIDNYIDACAVFRREVWMMNPYDEAMPIMGYEDWDFWINATEKGWGFHRLEEVCFDYRIHNSMNAEYRRTQTPLLIRQYIYTKHTEYYQRSVNNIYRRAAQLDYYHRFPFKTAIKLLIGYNPPAGKLENEALD